MSTDNPLDATPTWSAVLRLLTEVSINGDTPEARNTAYSELQRMAALADSANDLRELLYEAHELGLNFSIGTAYIRRSYITKQDELTARIKAALGQ